MMRWENRPFRRGNSADRGGIALVLVVIVMGVATILAYALLANSVMQEQAEAGQAAAVQAGNLADSGVALAMYYLQHPLNAPSLNAYSGTIPAYWPGGSNITFTGMSGTASVSVAPQGTAGNLWAVSSTGAASAGGVSYSKTVSATVQINGAFEINQSLSCNASMSFPHNLTVGENPANGLCIACEGNINGVSGLSSTNIAGNVSAQRATNLPLTCTLYPAPPLNPVPAFTLVRSYSTYQYQGQNCSADADSNLNLPLLDGIIPTAASNPAHIYASSGNMTIVGLLGGTINGTIYVPNGNLDISGPVTVVPTPGFPAVVVSGQIVMQTALLGILNSSLTANGLVYAGNGIGVQSILGNPADCSVTVNGALLMNTAALTASFTGPVTATYSAVSAPDFTSDPLYLTPQSAKIISWTP
jgi:hypothetical protein